jgi:hypothetical protein
MLSFKIQGIKLAGNLEQGGKYEKVQTIFCLFGSVSSDLFQSIGSSAGQITCRLA